MPSLSDRNGGTGPRRGGGCGALGGSDERIHPAIAVDGDSGGSGSAAATIECRDGGSDDDGRCSFYCPRSSSSRDRSLRAARSACLPSGKRRRSSGDSAAAAARGASPDLRAASAPGDVGASGAAHRRPSGWPGRKRRRCRGSHALRRVSHVDHVRLEAPARRAEEAKQNKRKVISFELWYSFSLGRKYMCGPFFPACAEAALAARSLWF